MNPSGYFAILISFFIAMVLAVFPMPHLLNYVRPEWVVMTLIFWILAAPSRVGILIGFAMGLLVDVLEGHLIGQSALAMSIVAYLTLALYGRLRLFNPLQQGLIVFVLVGLYQLIHYWAESMIIGQGQAVLLLPSLGSAVLWPLWYGILNWTRHTFRVG